MYVEKSVRTMLVLTLVGSFSGCASLQSNDSQANQEELLIEQAEIKESLYLDEAKTDEENNPAFKQTLMTKETEISETPKHVLFNSEDFSRYITETSTWLGEAFSWSGESSGKPSATINDEVEITSKSQRLNSSSPNSVGIKTESNAENVVAIEAPKKSSINQQVIEISAPLNDIDKPSVSKVEVSEAPVLVTEVLLSEPSRKNENEKLIAAINAITTENPSAAGIPMEVFEQEVRSRIKPDKIKAIQKQINEPSLNPLIGDSNAIKSWKGCAVSSPTIELDSPNYTTQMWLNVFEDRLMVNATTNIDINLKQVGIKVDDGKLQKFSSKLYASNVVWSADMQALFNTNKSLKIFIGGDELGRNRQAAEVSTAELKALYLANSTCSD